MANSIRAVVRAVVVDPAVADRLVIQSVEAPSPLPNEAIARVAD
jgi:hypothetical protein